MATIRLPLAFFTPGIHDPEAWDFDPYYRVNPTEPEVKPEHFCGECGHQCEDAIAFFYHQKQHRVDKALETLSNATKAGAPKGTLLALRRQLDQEAYGD